MFSFDAAGKTTILYKLKFGINVKAIPSIGFNIEVAKYNNTKFEIFDFGGGEKIR